MKKIFQPSDVEEFFTKVEQNLKDAVAHNKFNLFLFILVFVISLSAFQFGFLNFLNFRYPYLYFSNFLTKYKVLYIMALSGGVMVLPFFRAHIQKILPLLFFIFLVLDYLNSPWIQRLSIQNYFDIHLWTEVIVYMLSLFFIFGILKYASASDQPGVSIPLSRLGSHGKFLPIRNHSFRNRGPVS